VVQDFFHQRYQRASWPKFFHDNNRAEKGMFPKETFQNSFRTPSKDQGNTVLKFNTDTSQINTFERNLPSPHHHCQYPFLISGFKTQHKPAMFVSSQLSVGCGSTPKLPEIQLALPLLQQNWQKCYLPHVATLSPFPSSLKPYKVDLKTKL